MPKRIWVLAIVVILFLVGMLVMVQADPKKTFPGGGGGGGDPDITCGAPAPGICVKVGAIGWCDRSALNHCCIQCDDKNSGLFCLKCRLN